MSFWEIEFPVKKNNKKPPTYYMKVAVIQLIVIGKHLIQEHSTVSSENAFYYEKLFKTSLNLGGGKKKDRINISSHT